MTLARKVLDELSEAIIKTINVKSGTKVTDFDTKKSITLKSGKYEIVDSSDPDNLLISDEKGNLYFLKQ